MAQTPIPSRVLEIEDLSVRFHGVEQTVEAVRHLSLHVNGGETLAVVGESGSGKSVTALAVMRLVEHGGGRIAGGAIRFQRRDGTRTDLAQADPATLRSIRGAEIAMVFQEPMTSLNPVFTAGEQIGESIRLHQGKDRASARAEALRMLELVRIPEARQVLERFPHQLSGGMRQRVMIAMALACRPSLLIADEPTTAVDVTIQAQILALMQGLQREMGTALVFITHDMGVVAEMADRVAVMYRGEKVEEGLVSRIFESPEHPYTRALLSAVPRLGSMRGTDGPARFPLLAAEEAVATAPPPSDHPAPGKPLLRVIDLTTRFDVKSGVLGRVRRRVFAVERVTFELAAGETLGLVGESGCGKSTTGRSLLRLVDVEAGRVEYLGRELLELPRGDLRGLRRDIQMVFQDPYASLDPRLTVGFTVAEPLYIHGLATPAEAKDRVAELLERVGLPADAAHRYPHEFSGGQRQRICIARALALSPKVIIADEAVSALDVSIRAQIVNLLLDLQAQYGLSYLFISHDMAVVERIAHRVAVMYLGQIVEIGPRRAIFEDPRHPYTRRLLAAVPVADPAQRGRKREILSGEIPSPIRPAGDVPEVRPLEEVGPGHYIATHDVGLDRGTGIGALAG
jgi:ABC-type glutathione transport system ATPase component